MDDSSVAGAGVARDQIQPDVSDGAKGNMDQERARVPEAGDAPFQNLIGLAARTASGAHLRSRRQPERAVQEGGERQPSSGPFARRMGVAATCGALADGLAWHAGSQAWSAVGLDMCSN